MNRAAWVAYCVRKMGAGPRRRCRTHAREAMPCAPKCSYEILALNACAVLVHAYWRRFVLTLRDVCTGRASRLRAKFVMATHGILAGQYTLQQRGLDAGARFAGTVLLAGREGGRDCAVSNTDLTGKVHPCRGY